MCGKYKFFKFYFLEINGIKGLEYVFLEFSEVYIYLYIVLL